jgi:ATP-dependent Lon protease
MEQAPVTRTCKNCKETKELELFIKSKASKFGRSNWCKKCDAERARQRRRGEYEKKNVNQDTFSHEEYLLLKTCKHCNIPLTLVSRSKKYAHIKRYRCKSCHNKKNREYKSLPHVKIKVAKQIRRYYDKHKERLLKRGSELKKKAYAENTEKFKKRLAEYYNKVKNTEEFKQKEKEYRNKQKETLSEIYIRRFLRRQYDIPYQKITDEQVKLKREAIQLHREFKQLKQQLQ